MKTGFPPLDFVKLLENAYPTVWSTIDELRREAQKHFSWSDCCYILARLRIGLEIIDILIEEQYNNQVEQRCVLVQQRKQKNK